MKKLWQAALTALCLAGAASLSGCVADYDGYYGGGYDGGGYDGGGYGYGSYYGGGYCDAWGCPDSYWDMPLYYGSVYYGGAWVNGPFYYRDFGGGRQYWIHGGWRNDSWRGARPNGYREGRTGPALGRDFYRSDRFRNARPQRDFGNRGNRPDFNRDGNGGPRGGGRANAAPQQQSAPVQSQDRGRFQRGDGGGRNFGNRGGGDRGSFQRGDGGNRGGGDRGNRGRSR